MAQSWKHMSSAKIHVTKSQKKQPHVHTYPKTHTTKGKHIQKAWKQTKRRKVESTCHLHKYTSENRRKKQPHVQTYPKNTHNKGKKHPKGMKTHQKAQSWGHVSSAQIHVTKSQKKQPHVHTYPKKRRNRGKTHGLKPVSDLFGVSMFSVLPNTRTTKYYSSTTKYHSGTTQCYSSTTPKNYSEVLLFTTKY